MRLPTLNKAWQDGENLYRHARAVIVIDDDGKVIEVKNKIKGSLVNVLAILGPVTLGGTYIPRAVRAEIGFGRTTPYRLAETKLHGERTYLLPRTLDVPLTEMEQQDLLPDITDAIQSVVDEEVMHRKRLTYFKSRKIDSAEYGNGKFVTIPPDLPLLMFVCLAKDMKTRLRGHISEFISRTRDDLEKLTYAVYPPEELKRLKACDKIAAILHEADYGEHIFEIIRQKMGNAGSKPRALLEQIIEVFKLSPSRNKDLRYLTLKTLYGKDEHHILSTFPLDIVTHYKRVARREKKKLPNYKHALECLRIEVRPSKEAVARHGMQYQQQPSADLINSTHT